jgi:hypothetical protein
VGGHPLERAQAELRPHDQTDWDEVSDLLVESYRVLAPRKLAALLD